MVRVRIKEAQPASAKNSACAALRAAGYTNFTAQRDGRQVSIWRKP